MATVGRGGGGKSQAVEFYKNTHACGHSLDTFTEPSQNLRMDLINFVRRFYPGLVVDDTAQMVEDFCQKWPGYKNTPGEEYVCQLAEMLKIRGWR